jgi:integrase
MRFCKINNYDEMLQIEPKKLEGLIRDYVIYLREDRKVSPASISVYSSAIAHFYEMNDITINWKRLKKFKGRLRRVVEDVPYIRNQIKALLDRAGLRDRCMILMMASAGLRRGALTGLRLADLQKIEKYNLYRIIVYKREQEQYTTYCTPECTKLIDQYLKWRQRLGEKLQPDTILFRTEFDTTCNMIVSKPKPLKPDTIGRAINILLDKTGIRSRTQGWKMTTLMECHGFRKFFKTTCINAGMNPLYSEYLMGHRSGLTKSYFKPTDTELLEGNDKALGYVAAISDLTINEEHRLYKKIDELTKKNDEIKTMEIRHADEIKGIRDQMSHIISMIQHNPKLAHVKPEALITKMTG